MNSAADTYAQMCAQSTQFPDVFEFLSERPELSPRDQLDVLLVDQFQRWKNNQTIPVEHYVERLPQLDDVLKVELLVEEYGYLDQRGVAPAANVFISRYQRLSVEARRALCEELDVSPGTSVDETAVNENKNPPQSSSSSVDNRIGRYQIIRSIGKGAFGEVFLAHDPDLDRSVAIKIPTKQRIKLGGGIDEFLHEARAVAKLEHPNIVPVFDCGETADGECFVVSKYVKGKDLRAEIRNSVSHVEAAEIVATVAKAIHAAHLAGLVHRDVKPANIILDSDRQPHLLDFGLALRDQDSSVVDGLVGTPAYMSPEQARCEGHRVDGRSDIYSLGVVFYELLTGLRPFQSDSASEVLEQIKFGEVRPPRQRIDSIPRELERICLKALSRRLSDRYNTALDFAEEIQSYLETSPAESTIATEAKAGLSSTREDWQPDEEEINDAETTRDVDSAGGSVLRIVPKGLRSFDRNDADFFLSLVPGPRDRNGLPDTIRFWKNRLEERDPDATFTVGLLYGPSGCGKSSLVKAGLLPHIDRRITTIYLEATKTGTSQQLLKLMRKRINDLPAQLNLPDTMAHLRRQSKRKTVIIIDQFEQWLNAWRLGESSELVQAFRQCDGGHVQCLLMVRDDFWMAATRLMRELEVPLLEGHNSAAIDLFDGRHARKVLTAFGQAFGALPNKLVEINDEQEQFVHQAVDGLMENGRVTSIRLSLFAEMFKGRDWTLAQLKKVGGTEGVGVAFLDEAIGAKASPQLRPYSRGATAIVQALLPEKGSDIKGNMRSSSELMEIAGLQGSEQEFNELIDVLDGRLRLITPTESRDVDPGGVPTKNKETWYQLTHDYLVPSIRNWSTRQQRSTVRGRAKLRMAERAAIWNEREENKLLPGIFEYLQFATLTRRRDRAPAERRMMFRSAKQHLITTILTLLVLGSIGYTGKVLFNRFVANTLRHKLYAAEITQVPGVIRELDQFHYWADQYLEKDLANGRASSKGKDQLYALLAIADRDHERAVGLFSYVYNTEPDELLVVRDVLLSSTQDVDKTKTKLWNEALQPTEASRDRPLNAAGTLAKFDPNGADWERITPAVARQLTLVRPSKLDEWINVFDSVGDKLVEPLSVLIQDTLNTTMAQRDHAAEILSVYARDDVDVLCRLATKVEPSQFAMLLPAMRRNQTEVIEKLNQRIDNRLKQPPPVTGRWPELPAELKQRIEEARGVVFEDSAVALKVPVDQLDQMISDMAEHNYRPFRIRPYYYTSHWMYLVAWRRDTIEFKYRTGLTEAELHAENAREIQNGFEPVDISSMRGESELHYVATWQKSSQTDVVYEITANLTVKPLFTEADERYRNGFEPVSIHSAYDNEKQHRVIALWRKKKDDFSSWNIQELDRIAMQLNKDIGRVPIDFCIIEQAREAEDDPMAFRYLSMWRQPDINVDVWEQHHLMTLECIQILKEKHAENFRLLSIAGSQIVPQRGPVFGVTWTRPAIQLDDIAADARERAFAAATLYRLGQYNVVRNMLKHSDQLSDRSYLIQRLAAIQCNPDQLIEWIGSIDDYSIRRAIVQCLGLMREQLTETQRRELLENCKSDFVTTPDAGYRAAIEWLLRSWGHDEFISQANDRLASADLPADREWYVTPGGITMRVFEPQPSVWTGSKWLDKYRHSNESPRHIRINRRFAVATHEITNELYQEFLEQTPHVPGTAKNFRTTADGPAIGVRLVDAANFCNWLNEREGIPKDQWCFEPITDGKYHLGFRLPPDFLKRTGYRPPIETEWEFACRAGTRATRYYGFGDELIGHYSWHADNAAGQARPAGLKQPNDFGLFDMLGNVSELCLDFYRRKKEPIGLAPRNDSFNRKSDFEVLPEQQRVLRGGSFDHRYTLHRCAYRDRQTINFNSSRVGLRIVRTLPPLEEPPSDEPVDEDSQSESSNE